MVDKQEDITVIKIGGSPQTSSEALRDIVKSIASEYEETQRRMVVIVSAMKGETDRLWRDARNIYPADPLRQSKHVAYHGELANATTWHALLLYFGITAEILDPWDTRMMAGGDVESASDGESIEAYLIGMDEERFRDRLTQSPASVFIVPGYFVLHETSRLDGKKALVPLPRGGSDWIAVLIAAVCGSTARLIKSAGSVYAAPPEPVPHPKQLTHVPYLAMLRMLEYMRPKDQIIQMQALRYAMHHGVVIEFTSMEQPELITRIDGWTGPDDLPFRALTMREDISYVTATIGVDAEMALLVALREEKIGFDDAEFVLVQGQSLFVELFVDAADANAVEAILGSLQAQGYSRTDGTLLTLFDTDTDPGGNHFERQIKAFGKRKPKQKRSSGGTFHHLCDEDDAPGMAIALAKEFGLIE